LSNHEAGHAEDDEGLALALLSKEGVTAIEYGLIAALIDVAIIAAVTLLGTKGRRRAPAGQGMGAGSQSGARR